MMQIYVVPSLGCLVEWTETILVTVTLDPASCYLARITYPVHIGPSLSSCQTSSTSAKGLLSLCTSIESELWQSILWSSEVYYFYCSVTALMSEGFYCSQSSSVPAATFQLQNSHAILYVYVLTDCPFIELYISIVCTWAGQGETR